MRFASLGSGSRGNALIVDSGGTKLLVDCGFSPRATLQRLARLDVVADEIAAILVTHEHSDHVAGAFGFATRIGVPVYLTHGTHRAAVAEKGGRGVADFPECCVIDSQGAFAIGGLEVMPYLVPHDAREPVQYVISDGSRRLGVLTDTGAITPHIVATLRVCHALVLECNHDAELLAASAYPAMLKHRISSRFGHLDNDQAASLLRQIETRQLQHVVAAHLSEQNNRPEIVVNTLAVALNCAEDWIGVAHQESGFGWRQLF